MTVRLLAGDCRDVLPTLPGNSVHCCVTSPPYYGLRDYGTAGQIGIEASPAEYVAELVAIFREVRRVLRPDGTLWLNIGDSYAGANGNTAMTGGKSDPARGIAMFGDILRQRRSVPHGIKPKDLIGIPWMVAFALRADGWYLRQDIIWSRSKPNPMPESVTDRCTKAHEYLFLLSKSERYWFDAAAIAEPCIWGDGQRVVNVDTPKNRALGLRPTRDYGHLLTGNRNKRSVWHVASQPFAEAHFATFPPALIEPCILAGTSAYGVCGACGAPWVRVVEKTRSFESGSGRAGNLPIGKNGYALQGGGETLDIRRGPCVSVTTTGWQPSCACGAATVPATVLDPFAGAGTTGLVADRLQRDALLIELNQAYCGMTTDRITADAPLFAQVEDAL